MADFDSGFDAVKRADRIFDALSTGRRVPSNDPGDLAVASLLAHWRDDIRRGPVPELVSTRQAAAALVRTQQPQRNRFLPTVVGAVAAAMLCLGGFGAVLYDAHPGDSLYGLRTLVFGEAPAARDEQVALAAQSQLMEVQQLIQQGQWEQAQTKLAAASTAVRDVPDLERKQALIDQMNQLTVKVEARDANASLAPGAPPPPPLPGMVVPLPNVVEAPAATSSEITTTTTSTTTSTTSTTTTLPTAPGQQPPPVTTTTTTTGSPTPSTTTTTTVVPPTSATATAPATVTATAPATITATAPVTATVPTQVTASAPVQVTPTTASPPANQAPALAPTLASQPPPAASEAPPTKEGPSSGTREAIPTPTTTTPKSRGD